MRTFLVLALALACGGSESVQDFPDCGEWCGGGSEFISADHLTVTCVTPCKTSVRYAFKAPPAACESAKTAWLAALDACH